MTMARHASSFRTSNSPRTAWSRPAVAPTLTLVALLIGGIWELFLGGAHKGHLLGWIATALCVGLVGLALEYLRSREHLSEVRLAHDRLRLALVSARSAVWDLNVKTGIDQWFGDLQTMFGIPSEMMSVQTRDFYRYVHPEDRQRVSEAIAEARSKRSAYETEFRIVRQDETIHWVSASGEFSYSKRNDPERMLGMAVDITDRRQASEALFKSEEKFAKAFRESPIALTLTSARDTRYLDVNDTFAKITGWGRDEVIGRNPVDISIWVDASQRSEFIKQTLAHGTTRNFEVHYRCKNGEQRVGLGSGEIIDIEGEPSILTAVLDITDRKRSEESLLRKETELAEAQRLAQLGSWQMDPTNRSLTWSEELCRIHGFDPKGPLPSYDQLPQLFTPQSWQRLQEEMEIATQTGDFQDLELELIRPDGSKRWVTIRGQTVRSSAGKVISFRGTAQDITHVRQLVEQVRSSEARLGAIVGSAMDAIIVVDAKQQIILFNSAAEEMFRCPAGTVTGSDLDRFIPPPFSAEYQAHIQKLGQTSGTGRSKDNSSMLYAVRSNGEVFPIEASVSEVETDGKKLFTVIMRDVTQRQRAEQALRESEERFRLVANTAPVMIWMCGKDNSCNYVNKPWLDFTGRPVEAELGEGWRKGFTPGRR
jgi:PAS domain S-box-containing protein